MISRHWRGVVRRGEADRYVEHLRGDTLPRLSSMSGFLGASILKREAEGGVEFLVITRWRSMENIHQFAGEDAHRAVVPPVAQAMMTEYDREVRHYEVVEEAGDGGA